MKTETEANFSRSMPLWKIRISFLLKKEIKTRNLFLFMHQKKGRESRVRIGVGRPLLRTRARWDPHKRKIMEKGGLITVRVGMERKENNIWSSNCQKRFHFLGKKSGNTHSDTDIRVCSDHGVDPDPHGSTRIRTDPLGSARIRSDPHGAARYRDIEERKSIVIIIHPCCR